MANTVEANERHRQSKFLQIKSAKEAQHLKHLTDVNTEPAITNITNQEFRTLVEENKSIRYDNQSIEIFFRNIFNILNLFNICFSSGTFIFEESNNCLFNYLTYGYLVLNSNTYRCEEPEIGVIGDIMLPNTRRFGTTTHKKIYEKIPSCIENNTPPCYSSDICIPEEVFFMQQFTSEKSIINTKFQKIFDSEIVGICDTCINESRYNRNRPEDSQFTPSETKKLCLYYPFIVNTINFPNFPPPRERGLYEHSFLFVKFEAEPVSKNPATLQNIKHIGHLASARLGSKENFDNGIDTDRNLSIRREDKNDADKPETDYFGNKNKVQCNYKVYNRPMDTAFYNAIFRGSNNYRDKIMWYDENLRTGCEFFVTKELLEFFFIHFFNKPILGCDDLERFFDPELLEFSRTMAIERTRYKNNAKGGTRKHKQLKKKKKK